MDRKPDGDGWEGLTQKERDFARLFRVSYLLSQANLDLQYDLFRYAFLHGAIDKDLVTNKAPDYIARIGPPGIHKAVSDDVEIVHGYTWQKLIGAVRKDADRRAEEHIVEDVAKRLAQYDLKYQLKSRPGRKSGIYEVDSDQDPHASYLRRYVLAGQTTGVEVFDKLCERVKTYCTGLPLGDCVPGELDLSPTSQLESEYPDHIINRVTANLQIDAALANAAYYWEWNHLGKKFWDISL